MNRVKLCLTTALLSFAFGAAVIGFTVDRSDAATVERHAICWKGNKHVDGKHWRVWRVAGGWKDTTLECHFLWVKRFAVLDENGRVIAIVKHRSYPVPEGPPPNRHHRTR